MLLPSRETELRVKASILMLAYNHEKFISAAIESVLMQKVNFDYELLIGEDCSSDRTWEIAVSYQKNYSDRIKIFHNPKNIGMHRNFIQIFYAAKGDYIAFLEGDDYWANPHKLQTQIDFLDNHPDYSISSHNVEVIWEHNDRASFITRPNPNSTGTIEDVLAYKYPMPTCGLVIRSSAMQNMPPWLENVHNLDYMICVLAARHGKIQYIKRSMGVYRKHSTGISESTSLEYQIDKLVFLFEMLLEYLEPEFRGLVKRRLGEALQTRAKLYFKRGSIIEAIPCLFSGIWYAPVTFVKRIFGTR